MKIPPAITQCVANSRGTQQVFANCDPKRTVLAVINLAVIWVRNTFDERRIIFGDVVDTDMVVGFLTSAAAREVA
jgi:hypothetical protein